MSRQVASAHGGKVLMLKSCFFPLKVFAQVSKNSYPAAYETRGVEKHLFSKSQK